MGGKTGPNPTDRGKSGVKRSVLTEANGVPVGLAVAGANRHDMKLVRATVEAIPVERPAPTPEQPQGLCLDKGYDYDEVRQITPEADGSLASPPIYEAVAKRPKPSNGKQASKPVGGWWNALTTG